MEPKTKTRRSPALNFEPYAFLSGLDHFARGTHQQEGSQEAAEQLAGSLSPQSRSMVPQQMGSHFGVGAPPILVYFSGDWDVHWGYRVLIHSHMSGHLIF